MKSSPAVGKTPPFPLSYSTWIGSLSRLFPIWWVNKSTSLGRLGLVCWFKRRFWGQIAGYGYSPAPCGSVTLGMLLGLRLLHLYICRVGSHHGMVARLKYGIAGHGKCKMYSFHSLADGEVEFSFVFLVSLLQQMMFAFAHSSIAVQDFFLLIFE